MLERFRDARLEIRSSRMPAESVEFRVFVGDEKAVADTTVEANPAFAGTAALFGMGEMPHEDMMAMATGNFDLSVNLSDHLRTRCGHLRDTADDTHDHHHDQGKRGKSAKKQAEQTETDEPKGANLFLRVAAFDANGKPLDADQVPVDGIELMVD